MSALEMASTKPTPPPTGPWLACDDGRQPLILRDGSTGCGLTLLAAHPGLETWPRCGCCGWVCERGGPIV